MTYMAIGLAGGALAAIHCLGMCGGFALHLSRSKGSLASLGRQLLWHAGKTSTYVFLGALAGFGGGLIHALPALPHAQNVLSYLAGTVIIFMGLHFLGVPSPFRPRASSIEEGHGLFSAVFRNFFQEPTPAGALILGIATGFLPCPIIVAFLAYASHLGSVADGMIIMAGVGVGTLWALLLLGMSGHVISHRFQSWGSATAGVVLVLLGLTTILRGTDTLHRALGCNACVQQTGASTSKACAGCECGAEPKPPFQPEH